MKYTSLTEAELKTHIDGHFEHCRSNSLPFTLTGLAELLDMDPAELLPDEDGDFIDDLPMAIKAGITSVEAYKLLQRYVGNVPALLAKRKHAGSIRKE